MKIPSPSTVVLLLGVAILFSAHDATAFSCNDYSGKSASSSFCQETACANYCANHPIPEFCMEDNYISTSYCQQISGFPSDNCLVVTGIKPEHKHFCQTTACQYACPSSSGCNVQAKVLQLFSSYCTSSSGGNTPTTTTTKSTTTKSTTTTASKSTTTTKRTTTTRRSTTTTSSEDEVADGKCWTPSGWSGSDPCVVCENPTDTQCPQFSYTTCYGTKSQCEKANGGGGGGGGGSEGSTSSGYCKEECPMDTSGFTRPNFKGPSCYEANEFGSQFGPHWKPSGKTRWEHFVPDPTALHKLISVFSEKQLDNPVVNRDWKLTGCKAAVAVQENIVCALELIEARGVKFDGPKNNPGAAYSISDFANTGDEDLDRAEIAAFIGHKFKEVSRLTTWEETPSPNYADCTNPDWPCVGSHYYHGRGPVQISYNYNYGAFSQWFYGDKMILLTTPDMVDPEGPMGFIAALWFWMTPRDFTRGSLRTRDAIVHWTDGKLNSIYNDGKDYDSIAGFGLTTNVINGGRECNSGVATELHLWRIAYYLTVADRLGVKGVPDEETLNDWNKCKNNKWCYGLYSGCGAYNFETVNGSISCKAQETSCGNQYMSPDDWVTNFCTAKVQ